ncbi:EF-hand domain-containing protein 1 [Boothiomyces sp. JEL0866]|nr:EF-hand domain-containing protein 1 [Boothiomyces sp. JEL0866]
MSGPRPEFPFLPGNSFTDVNVSKNDNIKKHDFRKPHSLGFINGYPVQPKPNLGIGLEKLNIDPSPSEEELLKSIGIEQNVYGERKKFNKSKDSGFVPAHVAFDKVVLRFDAYFKQTVHESEEQYHLRKVRILYFLEDDSIAVVEPPVENSGIPQGVLIKRQKLPKSSSEFYKISDFNVAQNVTFYGKTFRITSCDQFTEKYLRETEGIILNPKEEMPVDPHQESRVRPARKSVVPAEKRDKLKRFLEKDRKVLRFYCIWDDRYSMFGELREFVLHYHLVDDSIEVREVQKPNNGRDPFPILLRRQPLPKVFKELSDVYESEIYTWKDLHIGACINVLGRPFLIRDCDDYTRRFYKDMVEAGEDVDVQAEHAIPVDNEGPPKQEQTLPPYNGFGTVEDSLGSVKYLVLKPPKKDFIKMLENEHKILRFVAKMESKHKEDQDRRFVISYRLADDMMTIYEPPQRNAGIIGGKFMERTRVLRPGSSLSDPQGPLFYDATDLYIGVRIEVLSHKFVLVDADEYVFNYMEADGQRFKLSNSPAVRAKITKLINSLSNDEKDAMRKALKAHDPTNSGVVDRQVLINIAKNQFPGILTEQEIITFSRCFEQAVRKPNYLNLLNSV